MKISNKLKQRIKYYCFKLPRVIKYRFLSTNENVSGYPIMNQPLQMNGLGKIIFGDNVTIGIDPSPYLYSSYCYVEARNSHSVIKIDSSSFINNGCTLIAEGDGIEIGKKCLIGTGCEIFDSDFHNLDPQLRLDPHSIKTQKVILEDNVFLGSNVKVLKGVTIGENSVIANGSVVTKSIEANVVAGGIPAKKIKDL
ncbi:MAG: acyltransferase [Campylobacterota bacterium]|nr:acyltransferase [Campylobacterota bacterium]